MKKVLLATVLAAAGLGTVTPALAQYAPPPPPMGGPGPAYGWNRDAFWRGAPGDIWQRISFLQNRIDRGIADGSLDRREGWRANKELARIRGWVQNDRAHHYGRIDPQTASQVQDRLDRLSQSIRWMRHNGW